jgi:hypothetical protein
MAGSMLVALPTTTFADEPEELELAQNVEKTAVAVIAPMFSFTIRTPAANSEFKLPISSSMDGVFAKKSYNWFIDWGDGSTQTVSGMSDNGAGIPHTYMVEDGYVITISPNGSTEAWLAAFGFSERWYIIDWYPGYDYNDSLTPANKAMVIGVQGPITPEMTRTTAQINGTAAAPDNEWAFTFLQCNHLAQAPSFVGWGNVTNAGKNFAANMFAGCTSLTSLPDGFNLPQDFNGNVHGLANNMFYDCQNLTTLPSGFNLPQGITSAGDDFAKQMFMRCTSLTTLPEGFNLPPGIVLAGNGFASNMFRSCASLATLPVGFNLPQGLVVVGKDFASGMLDGCASITTLPAGFNLPINLTVVGDNFASNLLASCRGLKQLPDGFNLPQGITEIGNLFVVAILYDCQKLESLPTGFNLPQNITDAKNSFAVSMFSSCSSLRSLPYGFNLPQGIIKVGNEFAFHMFYGCTSLDSLLTGFNLPQGITEVGYDFVYRMFSLAGSTSFQINSDFCFPAGVPADSATAFRQTFDLSNAAPVQNRTAASIIGNCQTPITERFTFDSHFSDLDYIAVNWGGKGLTKPGVGAPGSGDLFGDGVSVANALIVARVVTGAASLTPEQFAAADMDFDGYLTMADVILIMRKATGL